MCTSLMHFLKSQWLFSALQATQAGELAPVGGKEHLLLWKLVTFRCPVASYQVLMPLKHKELWES